LIKLIDSTSRLQPTETINPASTTVEAHAKVIVALDQLNIEPYVLISAQKYHQSLTDGKSRSSHSTF